ncbi:hypothetical protein [Streptomyces cinereoruber]|uniref:hypothetical protein n=1 Tax=Streptomyces cinereoruber TaxID=67260 RepID=UPI0036289F8A
MNTALALAWAALPEFLGSLSAGLVVGAATWAIRRLHARRAHQNVPTASAERLPS